MKSFKIIAEIGSTHDGKINLALKSIKKAAKCGADIIKFQMHIAEEETLKDAPGPSYFKKEKRYDYFKRTAFSIENWKKIILECKKNKVEFLCSPFSIRAVEILEFLKVKYYKVPSGELTNLPLLERLKKTKKFIFLSTGMSNYQEIDNAIKVFFNRKKLCLMQCTSIYPCPDELVGLNVMNEFKKKYKVNLGFSDHTLDNLASICFTTLGANFVEKHFTLSKKLYGSDAKFAMEPIEFKKYCSNIKRVWEMRKNKVNKNNLKPFIEMKKVFEKSIVAKRDMKKLHKIKFDDLMFLKPGTGIRADKYKKLIGLKIKKPIKELEILKISNLSKN